MQTPDFLWEVAFGSWTDVMACAKRAKKFAKLGIYVEIEELTRYNRRELSDAIAEGKEGFFAGVIQPHRKLVRSDFDITKHEEVYRVCLYGPARKNVSPVVRIAPKKPGKQIPVTAAKEESVKAADEFFVIQQVFPGAVPDVSSMLTRAQAEYSADSAHGVISYIVQVVKAVDNRIHPRKKFYDELATIASALSANPSSALVQDIQKMKAILTELESM